MFGRTALLAKNVATTVAKRGYHGGVPGENLPFSIQNRYRLTALFMVFFGSGFSAPFLILRHQLLKK